MGGMIAAVTSGVNYTLPDTLVTGMTIWVKNSSAGNITITAPTGISGATFRDGNTTMTLPAGAYGCFVNNGGRYIHSRIFTV